ncbi:MAG: hypothetical protein JXA78_06260, partial [Anaerolineales bacterium]|nr:hypothetical protein [Anaerolineales bacterium]
ASRVLVLVATKLYHEKPLSVNLSGEGIDMNRMLFGDMVGIFAYSQAVALIESLLFWGFLVFVCISLPRKLFKDWFVSQGALMVMGAFILVIPMHYQMSIIEGLQWNMGLYRILVVVWVLLCLAGLIGASMLIRRSPKFKKMCSISLKE